MFCDLVGSTALSAQLDPEDMREIIGAYHRCCADEITKIDGFVAKYMGDGVLAYFGYPQAHEDDAERAVQASLALIEAVPKLRAPHDAALQVRVGVATGLVVVGDLVGEGVAQEHGVVGDTPNLAARLQARAEPGQVVIANSTRRLTGGMFEYRDLGRLALKGLADPVQAWVVTSASAIQSRFEARQETSLTPLVGREEELDLLMRRWRQAASGEGRVVLLSGEPGIGKSRLTVALQERLEEPHTRLRYFCSPQHTDSALYPVISQLERAAAFERHDTADAKLDKLKALLAPGHERDVQLLAELLSIPTGDRYAPLDWSAQRKKDETFRALLRQLEMLSRQRPVLIIYEDAHWCDPSTRELLDITLERGARLPVLLVITFRPEFQPPWIGQAHVSTLSLNRLGPREGAGLAERVAGSKALPGEIMAEIVERSDGIPLFVEELTKAVVDAGADGDAARRTVSGAPHPALSVPATLHASLIARLDRLGPLAKEIAQIGAAIGREFSYQLVASVVQKSQSDLTLALTKLIDAGLLFCRGTPPEAYLLFKHALVRDAAYGSLLRSQRQLLHHRVVSIIERDLPEMTSAQPELLAQHCAEAMLTEKAIGYWLKAGQQAMERSAMAEAIAQLRKGLSLVAQLPADRARQQRELALQTALGTALTGAKGYAAAETGEAYARARSLCEELGDTPVFARVAYGQYLFHLMRAEVQRSYEVAAEILAFAHKTGSEEALILGHRVLGVTYLERGQFTAARDQLNLASRLLESQQGQSEQVLRGRDARIMIPTWMTDIAWLLGYLDQGQHARELALSEARASSSLHSRIFAQCFAVNHLMRRGEYQRALPEAAAICDVAGELAFPYFLACGLMFKGIAKSHLGDQEGVRVLGEGLELYRRTGAKWALPMWLWQFASAPGQPAEVARQALEEALALVGETGERWNESELYRLRGDFARAASVPDEKAAEADYLLARRIAANQEAKLPELRAATSLALLWRDQGKRSEARDLLAPIYGWFTEGFDTPDLKGAKALLDELS